LFAESAEGLAPRFFKLVNWTGIVLSFPLLVLAGAGLADSHSEILPEQVVSAIGTMLFPGLAVIALAAKRMRWLGVVGLVLMVVVRSQMHQPWPTDVDNKAYAAVRTGNAQALRVALARGADPNMYTWDRGYLLSAAVSDNNPEIIKILIDAGADVNIRKADWSTPLLRAVYVPRCEAALVLLEAGASPHDRFYDHAHYTDPPTYYGKTVAEIYRARKVEWRKSWEKERSCWLRFEQVLKNPPPTAWTARRVFQEVVLCAGHATVTAHP